MKLLFFCILIPCSVYGSDEDNGLAPDCLDRIRSPNNKWKISNDDLAYEVHPSLHKVYAARIDGQHNLQHKEQIPSDDLPENFDARVQWPYCRSLNLIRDQSNCGSCWAVSAASAISDRICIHSNGTIQDIVSSVDILSCSQASAGCSGGPEQTAWEYWVYHGVVTGGEFGTHEGCRNYPIPPHLQIKDFITPTPPCKHTCDEDSAFQGSNLLHKGRSAYVVAPRQATPESAEKLIRHEIFNNGPVTASFNIYADFFRYVGGIYHHVCGDLRGAHAIKLIGWGVENGTKYWLVSNSWGKDWGEKGLFKIVRGVNDCEIESGVVAGLP